jgi:hypothetical protein
MIFLKQKDLFFLSLPRCYFDTIQWHVESQNTDVPLLVFWMIFGAVYVGRKDLLRKMNIHFVSFLAYFCNNKIILSTVV